jgi:hypothetical protein
MQREALLEERSITLPYPSGPVPISLETFPDLPNYLRGQTSNFPSKLNRLEHYYISPSNIATTRRYAERPTTIGLDGRMSLALFQGFGGTFLEGNEMLAISSGSFFPLTWEGTRLGNGFNIHQFQTARFVKEESRQFTDEQEALEAIGFFDWRAILIDYFKQSFAYLRSVGKPHPQYIAVPLIRYVQRKEIDRLAFQANTTRVDLEAKEAELMSEQAIWLRGQGFGYFGFCPTECMFCDIREVGLRKYFKDFFSTRPDVPGVSKSPF